MVVFQLGILNTVYRYTNNETHHIIISSETLCLRESGYMQWGTIDCNQVVQMCSSFKENYMIWNWIRFKEFISWQMLLNDICIQKG